ncbi:MAG: hypothetical protein ABIF08_04820 [Nanoarchaeota archaeon]
MWKKLSKEEQERYHRKWIRSIIKDETPSTIKKHVIKHSKEIYKKEPAKWSASMHNLIDIFDEMFISKPKIENKLERLENKYKKNPRRYTKPLEI